MFLENRRIQNEIKKALQVCKDIKIHTIVVDNFRAQVKAYSNVI